MKKTNVLLPSLLLFSLLIASCIATRWSHQYDKIELRMVHLPVDLDMEILNSSGVVIGRLDSVIDGIHTLSLDESIDVDEEITIRIDSALCARPMLAFLIPFNSPEFLVNEEKLFLNVLFPGTYRYRIEEEAVETFNDPVIDTRRPDNCVNEPLITGPNGECYYLDANGNETYVDSLCCC